jgi:3-(3-hydroxy-phenyl)propionate hydroxylase
VFIAGDAAHQQPPFTGQGMCQGVRDVANLAWKLVRVISGRSSDALLDTYASERREHVKRLTTVIKGIGRVICERDVQAARARDERMLAESGGKVITQARQDLIPPLSGGLLSPVPHAANGTIFPQPRIQDGNETVLLDTIAGTGFRIVTNDRSVVAALDAATRDRLDVQLIHVAVTTALRDGGGPAPHGAIFVTEVEGVVAEWFQRHGCKAAIVRPDHYVFGVAANSGELEQQLEALRLALA